jgi:large subunit ribosomal protein L25
MATATDGFKVQGDKREAGTKNDARRVRRAGKLPATVYGAGKESLSVSVDPKLLGQILHSASGHNTIFDLALDGEQTKAMIVDWQKDPIKGHLLHVDLKRIAMDKKMRVSVPIVLSGVPVGVKTEGGILEQMVREIELECLPADIPSSITVDVTALTFGQVLRVKDLPHGGTLHFITEEETPVAHVTHIKEVAAPTPVEEAAAATPAEPEVIKKGKQETEGAAPAAGEKPEKAEKGEKKK